MGSEVLGCLQFDGKVGVGSGPSAPGESQNMMPFYLLLEFSSLVR